jgi:3-oxoacyl-[acyl-carrier protein] reductase
MDLGLREKVALVVGGSQGLGKAVAMEMSREGAKIAIGALDDPELPKAVEEVSQATGGEIIGIPVDVTDGEQARRFVQKSLEHYGTLDILVNNAGGPPSKTFLEIDDDLWYAGFRLDLMSTIIMTREAVRTMVEKRWGRIINMTSVAIKQPTDGLILPNVVRSGVIGLAKALSSELAPYNITVNNVCAGYTMTERVRELSIAIAEKEGCTPEDVIKSWEASIPMGRLGTVEEFSALVAFLVSERASYISGVSIQIDGGYYKEIM